MHTSGARAPTFSLRPRLDPLGQQLVRQVLPVAKAAALALAPGKDSTIGGDGKAVHDTSRHGDDALASEGLDLLRQQLVLLVAVAQLATGSFPSLAPAPDGAAGGEG